MQVILKKDVQNLGEAGDLVNVKDGYARNYLLPTKTAVIYNKANAALFKSRAAAIEKRKAEKRAASASLKERLDGVSLAITVPAGESGKLFGSVTSSMVQAELAKLGFDIEKKKIEVATHAIKMTGTYSITVHLYENDLSHIKLVVMSEAEKLAAEKAEAEAKAKAEAEAAKAAEEAAAAAEETAEEAPAEEPAQEETASEEN